MAITQEALRSLQDPRVSAELSPPTILPRQILGQPASWDAATDQPLSFRELVASRFPTQAALLGLSGALPDEPIRRISELSSDEVTKVVVAILQSADAGGVETSGRFSNVQLTEQIRNGSPEGTRRIRMVTSGLARYEALAELGKIIGVTDP